MQHDLKLIDLPHFERRAVLCGTKRLPMVRWHSWGAYGLWQPLCTLVLPVPWAEYWHTAEHVRSNRDKCEAHVVCNDRVHQQAEQRQVGPRQRAKLSGAGLLHDIELEMAPDRLSWHVE